MCSLTEKDFVRKSEQFKSTIFALDERVRPGMAVIAFLLAVREERVSHTCFDSESWQLLCTYLFFEILGFTVEDALRAAFIFTEEDRHGAKLRVLTWQQEERSALGAAMDAVCECAQRILIMRTQRRESMSFVH